MSSWSIAGKTVLITGANAGIGKATAAALAQQGARVVITARDPDRGAAALAELKQLSGAEGLALLPLDLASFSSIERCAEAFLQGFPRLDVLINNAGLILSKRRETPEGFEGTFGVNHLGPFLLTRLLRERLIASAPARVITVASKAHSLAPRGLNFDDLQNRRSYDSLRVYGESKLANIYFARELARRLAGSGVTSNSLHPGVVNTRFSRDGDMTGLLGLATRMILAFAKTPAQGARTSIHLATSSDVAEMSGRYFRDCREAGLGPIASDAGAARRLWEVSEALVAERRAKSGP